MKWVPLVQSWRGAEFLLPLAIFLSGCNPLFETRIGTGVPVAFVKSWTFDATPDPTQSYSFDGARIEFTGGVCSLKLIDQIDDDYSTAGFLGGSAVGITYGTLSDGGSTGLKLGSDGLCNGATSNCAELAASWTPQWANLVGYWKLNEVTGSAGDATGNGNSGAIVGTVSQAQTGYLNYGGSFATSGMLNVGHGATINTVTNNSYTMAAWVQVGALPLNTTSDDVYAVVFGRATGVFNGMMGVYNDGKFFHVLNDGAYQTIYSASAYPIGKWHHLVVTVDDTAKAISLYVDGIQSGTSLTYSGAIASSTGVDYGIGGRNQVNFNERFSGSIDEVAFWSKALTATEVRTIYNRQSASIQGANGGVFTSRVMDALSTGMSWTSLSWIATLPFLKELPDYASGAIQNESSSGYSALVGSTGSLSDDNLMSGIVGLWHLNESAGAVSAKDDSGKGYNGTATGITFGGPGKLATAATFDGAASNITSTAAIPTVFAAASMSAWFMASASGTGGTIVSQRYLDNSTGIFMTAVIGGGTNYIKYGRSTNFNSAVNSITPGVWTHVAITIALDGTANLYINGVFAKTGTVGTVNYGNACGLSIGMNKGGGCAPAGYFNGAIDEVGVWSRGLDPKEIFQLYRRGANRIKYQVRNCTVASCSDDATGINWKGPDGTNLTYFSELNNNTVPLDGSGDVKKGRPSLALSGFTNPISTSRYFQYRMILESDDLSTGCNYGSGSTRCSPELKSVTVDPTRYDSSGPSVIGKAAVSFVSLSAFTETLGSSCSAGVGYNLGIGTSYASATWYWWDPSSGQWSVADGTVIQSSSASVVNAHVDTFGAKFGQNSVYFKAFLKSSGIAQCELNQLDLNGTQ